MRRGEQRQLKRWNHEWSDWQISILYDFANLNIIKKIESSEITRSTLSRFHQAMEKLEFVNQIAVVHMGAVQKPDTLVQVADFFLKMSEDVSG